MALGAVAGALPQTARAGQFSPAQKAEIIAIMRDAMKQDPSILRDAITALQADDNAKAAIATRNAIVKYHAQIIAATPGMIAGNPNGSVTVVEFYDTRCPYCRKMVPEIAQLLHDEPNVKWIYKDFPVLGPNSTLEAKALLAADRQGGYVKLQALFLKQGGTETEDNIAALAASAGLDAKKLLADMKDPAIAATINANLALGNNLNIDGTPAFIIGTTMVPGVVDLDDLKKIIAQEE
jgi:protein-disulfide isomerase